MFTNHTPDTPPTLCRLGEFGSQGRWRGRLTQTEPPEDESIHLLSVATRERIAQIWLARASMERRVADSFGVVSRALVARRAPSPLIEIAERAIDDEYRHTDLSYAVACAYAGRTLAPPLRLPLVVPAHRTASPELRHTLHIIGQCVLNETTAGAFLSVSRNLATAPYACWALRELLSDEIDHARVGWAYLATLSANERAEASPYLLPMAYLNLQIWRAESPLDPNHTPEMTAHGIAPAEAIYPELRSALEDLIVPGLCELGMNTVPISAWLERGAPTDAPPLDLALLS